MKYKDILKIFVIIIVAVIGLSCVSAGLLDNYGDSGGDEETDGFHEFNYGNKATFKISDNLTDKTGVESISFGSGVSYDYPDGDLICFLCAFEDYGGTDDVERNQNDAFMEEIESEPTSQGYETYIFKWDDINQYDVYIDLDNLTISEDGFDSNYKYFVGNFETLDEAKVFIDSFKINDDATK